MIGSPDTPPRVRHGGWLVLWIAMTSCNYPALPALVSDTGDAGDGGADAVSCDDLAPAADGSGVLELATPSCAGLAATCGPSATSSCCQAARVPGGTFCRDYDRAMDGQHKSMMFPATVSAFVLDRYEVTVGRFRKFVTAGAGTQATSPADAAGAHPRMTRSGWDSSWNPMLPVNTAALMADVKCEATYQTWTDASGPNENKPMNCVQWYLAMAFCIWDGGYLPTEAEWNFAASGGSEHRSYPWSSPPGSTIIDCGHANYQLSDNPVLYCTNGVTGSANRVGTESPLGDGKWTHSDLAGNVYEWVLDWYAGYSMPCVDCANLDMPPPEERVLRGGGFFNSPGMLLRSDARATHRAPRVRGTSYGFRCARPE
jgi:sulfatase modifying factor 1